MREVNASFVCDPPPLRNSTHVDFRDHLEEFLLRGLLPHRLEHLSQLPHVDRACERERKTEVSEEKVPVICVDALANHVLFAAGAVFRS